MSIILTPYVSGSLCHGHTWTVPDLTALAEQLASVALGQSSHVERILAGTGIRKAATAKNAARGAIGLLTAVDDPWHRDGWMFQVMSWIAAHAASPADLIRAPQMIHAHKGFDGLELALDDTTGKVTAVVIFEDKATENPRGTVREDVWKTLKEFEDGDQENVLVAEVVTMLGAQNKVDPDSAIENIIWKTARHYRVAVTVGDTHATDVGRAKLFKGYKGVAKGKVHRRKGETFYVKDLRNWMQALADAAIARVKLKVAHV